MAINNLRSRLGKLENATTSQQMMTTEQFEVAMLELAASHGHTQESAFSTFGGWPGLCNHVLEVAQASAHTEPATEGALTARERYMRALKLNPASGAKLHPSDR